MELRRVAGRLRLAVWVFCATFSLEMVALRVPTACAGTSSGSIYITTLPSGANVFVDGTYVGRSPALVAGLGRGHHAITLTKTGWNVQELDVSVGPGTVAMSSTRLAPGARAYDGDATGAIVMRGMPAGASVWLDGNALRPPSGPFQLPAGPHDIAMKTERGRTTRSIDVLPQTTTQVVLTELKAEGSRTSIVAPAADYLPTDAFSLIGKKIVVRYGGHVVVAHLGDSTARIDGAPEIFDAPPDLIAGRLYLPLPLLEKLTGDTSK